MAAVIGSSRLNHSTSASIAVSSTACSGSSLPSSVSTYSALYWLRGHRSQWRGRTIRRAGLNHGSFGETRHSLGEGGKPALPHHSPHTSSQSRAVGAREQTRKAENNFALPCGGTIYRPAGRVLSAVWCAEAFACVERTLARPRRSFAKAGEVGEGDWVPAGRTTDRPDALAALR
jgi:hypothetical protein